MKKRPKTLEGRDIVPWLEQAAEDFRTKDVLPSAHYRQVFEIAAREIQHLRAHLPAETDVEERPAVDLRVLASAMKKMLPPDLLQDVIDHLDPLGAFVRFLKETPLC